jgi:LssY-like putative type I secretion system component LssY
MTGPREIVTTVQSTFRYDKQVELMYPFLFLLMAAQSPKMVPAGTPLHVRLSSAVGSYASRPHTAVDAVLIAPVKVAGQTILPPGTLLHGEVNSVRRVGLGLVRETASLELSFHSVSLVDGPESALPTRLVAVDTGREVVTPNGFILQTRSTGSLGNRAGSYVRKLILWDVHAQLALWAVNSLVILPEPEIYLPTGTELTLMLTAPVPSGLVNAAGATRALTPAERDRLAPVIAGLTERTSTPVSGRSADLINLLFVGSRERIAQAFTAAGWTEARLPTVRSGVASAWAVVRDLPFPEAPMSALLLDAAPAGMSWQKGSNDVSKRHHIRLWKQAETADGEEVWAAAATRDIDFAYARHGAWMTHKIAEQLDQERDKVAADIEFTACAEAVDVWDRPEIPRLLTNATGDRMETDGRLGVILLNGCKSPHRVGDPLYAETLPVHGGAWQRMLRREILCVRSDLIRDNLYWRTYEGARTLITAIRQRRQTQDPDAPPPVTLASRLFPERLSTIVSYR